MAISGTTTVTNDTAAASAAMKKSVGLNKDDFLKLFISELKYQDPLKPQDPSAMLNQLSQLSLVEQSYNNNTALTNLLNAQNNNTSISAVSYIGKSITANGNSTQFDGANPTQLQFAFDMPVTSAAVTIRDAAGTIIKTLPLPATSAGNTVVSWDGRDANGALQGAGSYTFSVSGTLTGGTSTAAKTYTSGKVDGVSMNNGTPLLTIGAASVALSDIITIKGV